MIRPVEDREKWDRRFLSLAKEVSTWSKDPSTKCGAVLVNHRRQVVGMGYNGFPRGVWDRPDRYDDRETKYKMIVHAEVNALIHAGDKARGATLYVYPSFMIPPICSECAKVAIQCGISAIVGFEPSPEAEERAKRWQESILIARQMFTEANIQWRSYDE